VEIVALIINLDFFDIPAFSAAIPSFDNLTPFILAAVLLTINHSWIMTVTEITRIKYKMYATPEEWMANDRRREDVAPEGVTELERVHNTHRNTTENMIYLIALSFGLLFLPTALAIDAWLLGFAVCTAWLHFIATCMVKTVKRLIYDTKPAINVRYDKLPNNKLICLSTLCE